MAQQKGREFLIKIGDGGTTEIFTTIAGLTAKSFTINTEKVDATVADATTPGGVMWQQSLDGVKSMSISGTATFIDATNENRLRAVAEATPPVANFQAWVPQFGYYSGAFFVESFQMSGDVNSAVTHEFSISSTGPVTFTAI